MKTFVTKGKLVSGSVEVDFIRHEDNDEISVMHASSKATPTKAFIKALEALAIHAAIIAEFEPKLSIEDIKQTPGFIPTTYKVTGFSIKGGELMKGVVISATKTLSVGKILPFNTPFVFFKDDTDEAYSFAAELLASIKKCQKEFVAYLDGKHGSPDQSKLDFNTPPDPGTDPEDTSDQPVKKAKRIKKAATKKAKEVADDMPFD